MTLAGSLPVSHPAGNAADETKWLETAAIFEREVKLEAGTTYVRNGIRDGTISPLRRSSYQRQSQALPHA
jgi:hypothetical protein